MIQASDPPSDDFAMKRAKTVLFDVFGHDAFRRGQEDVIQAVLAGRDVLCVMPTGAGKSLCYQLPALVREGLTLVISPLIALMQDQVQALRQRGVEAGCINSMVPSEEQYEILDAASRGDLRLLYVAPERFRNAGFRRRILATGVNLVAVDEAHCISQWGHDFRPDYRRIGDALESLGHPQVLALTATAPKDVQDDVVKQLNLREPLRFVRGIVRENLRYEVARASQRDSKERTLLATVKTSTSTLIYCATRKQVDRLFFMLRDEGFKPRRYHAGLTPEERDDSQRAFLVDGAPLLIATNAFGMGVDRPDIRTVVHYEIPRTIEAYVQESGRAGRDGEPARCLLIYSPGDTHIQRFFIDASNPSEAVVRDVYRVLTEAGDYRLELSTDEIAERLRMDAPASAVGAALSVLHAASVVRRGKRGDNLAKVTVYPPSGDLFEHAPLPPGLSRLLAELVRQFDVDRMGHLDAETLAAARGVTVETVRRGLRRLCDLGRIDYVPAFRGRATEVRRMDAPEIALESVDFAKIAAKRTREEHKLDQMIDYATTPGCRVLFLLRGFGVETSTPCGSCDRCDVSIDANGKALGAIGTSKVADKMIRHALRGVEAFDGRYGFRKLAGHLAGSSAAGIANGPLARGVTRGVMRAVGTKGAERYLRMAHDLGLIKLVSHRLQGRRGRRVHLVAISDRGRRVLSGEPIAQDS